MAAKRKSKSKAKDPPPPIDDESDGDKTPTLANWNGNESDGLENSVAFNTSSIVQDDSSKNPHSAQASLAQSLNPPDHVARRNQLMATAAQKAAKRKEKAI